MTVYNGIGQAIDLPERAMEPPAGQADAAETREEQLDYCMDFFSEFVEFAESYIPGIVDEFCAKYPWQYKKWLQGGTVIMMGGRDHGR